MRSQLSPASVLRQFHWRWPRSVSRQPGARSNTARDSTYSGSRSNSGFSHHISSQPSHGQPSATPSALHSTNTGKVKANHADHTGDAFARSMAAPRSIASRVTRAAPR
ncbi:hypothetical protein RLIN73S_01950 [Rhodanobacter lindaniclasticus]